MTTYKYKSASTSQLTCKILDPDKIIRFYSFEVRRKSNATYKIHPTFARSSLSISSSGGVPLQPSEAPSKLDGLYSAARTGDLASSFIHSIIRQFLFSLLLSCSVTMAVAVLFVTVCVHSYGHAVSLGFTSFIPEVCMR
jgi:hypothetical protein